MNMITVINVLYYKKYLCCINQPNKLINKQDGKHIKYGKHKTHED